MKKIFLFSLAMLLELSIYAQAPFIKGINFPFRSPETTHLNDFLDRLSKSGAPIMRQKTYADVYWKNIEQMNRN